LFIIGLDLPDCANYSIIASLKALCLSRKATVDPIWLARESEAHRLPSPSTTGH
jgi:hypothetical protein